MQNSYRSRLTDADQVLIVLKTAHSFLPLSTWLLQHVCTTSLLKKNRAHILPSMRQIHQRSVSELLRIRILHFIKKDCNYLSRSADGKDLREVCHTINAPTIMLKTLNLVGQYLKLPCQSIGLYYKYIQFNRVWTHFQQKSFFTQR